MAIAKLKINYKNQK